MADKTLIMKEAQKYLAKGQVDKAIAEWEKLVKEAPDGNAYNTIGDLYLKKGDKKNSIDSYHKAANFFRHEGFTLKALALYKKVLNINPADADALYCLGELSEEKGLATDAIKYYLATADSLSKEGKRDRLLDIYQKILSLSPSNIPLRIKVAETFLKEGLKTDAAQEYVHVARVYEEKNDMGKAREYYQKVLDLQPLNKDAIISLSSIYERSGEFHSAIEHIQEAAALFPEDPDVLLRCSELLVAQKRGKEAEVYLRRILEADPVNVSARKLLGEMYLREGMKDKAWTEYLPALDEMIIQEKYDDARKILEDFRDTDPLETGKRLVSLFRQIGQTDRVVSELVALGDALKDRDMNDDAVSCYQEALEMNPDDMSIQERISELEKVPEPSFPETGKLPDIEPFGAPEPGPIPGIESLELPAPLDEEEPDRPGTEPPPAKRLAPEHISIKAEKTVEEIFTEADIFSRYGLLSEAKRLLEGLKARQPHNIEVHGRLKSLYGELSDTESFVTECIVLGELYRRAGDSAAAEAVLREAYEKSPDDPRLLEKAAAPFPEPASSGVSLDQPFDQSFVERPPDIQDFEEDIAEADFYARQGLAQEAAKILERLQKLFPDNRNIAERLATLGQTAEAPEPEFGMQEVPEVDTSGIPSMQETTPMFEMPEPPGIPAPEEEQEAAGPEPTEALSLTEETTGFEEIFSEKDLVEAQEMPEPELESDVLEIFQEFKKGLEQELAEGDSETHYNLGIAYKEMGLIDDAIKEFQTSRDDPKRFMQSSTMLGICYMEKGLYPLAIGTLNNTLKKMPEKDDAYRALEYDLAEAHEKNGDLKEAMELYTEVYGWNAKFREVARKISQLGPSVTKAAPGAAPPEKPQEPAPEKPKGKRDRVSYL